MEPPKVIDQILYENIEPTVIDDTLLQRAIVEQGPIGEARRLATLEPIRYENVTSLRLELSNILRIDHLWVLPNLERLFLCHNAIDKIDNLDELVRLRELDLSFNNIEKIENLDGLAHLETLSLFGNAIVRLENLDNLTRLIILSVGNNHIDSRQGIERFRFLEHLCSLNLEGNPIADDNEDPLRIYIAAFLPRLKYYNYAHLLADERAIGLEKYKRELRNLAERENDEIAFRAQTAKEAADEIRLADSFVELLNANQLFDSLFVNDAEGTALLSIGDEANELVAGYRQSVFKLTQQIYQLGLEAHERRSGDLDLFQQCILNAQLAAQTAGQEEIRAFNAEKVLIVAATQQQLAKLKSDDTDNHESPDLADAVDKCQTLAQEFDSLIDRTWQRLMDAEIFLYERIEEANTKFGHELNEMINKFIEQAQGVFVQLRDLECSFDDELSDAVTGYVNRKLAANEEASVPQGLAECLEDRGAIMQLIAGMRENHMQTIDAREDKLIQRGRDWADHLCTQMQTDAIDHNRTKVMEINYFLEHTRRDYEKLHETGDDEDF